MNETTMITAALNTQQSLLQGQIGMAVLKSAEKSDQAFAEMLRESVRAGQTIVNQAGPGSIDLYV